MRCSNSTRSPSVILTALDGITYAITSGKAPADLLAELSKKPGEAADYLEAGRAYRCEDNVFEDFTQEERDAAFGKPPATVWENIKTMKANKDKVAVITAGDSLNQVIVDSFLDSIEYRWENELVDRIIPAIRFFISGIIILAIARSSHSSRASRSFPAKMNSMKNVGNLSQQRNMNSSKIPKPASLSRPSSKKHWKPKTMTPLLISRSNSPRSPKHWKKNTLSMR